MIETLSLRNFKVLREVDVRLRPLMVIVGPNASGKTTLLRVLDAIAEFLSRNDMAGPSLSLLMDELRSSTPNRPLGLECSYQFGGEAILLSLSPRGFEGRRGTEKFKERWGLGITGTHSKYISLDVRKLASRSFAETRYSLPSDGEGLSALLADLYLEYPNRYMELVHRLKEVVPVVRNLSTVHRKCGDVLQPGGW